MKKHKISEENNKIVVAQGLVIPLTKGSYTWKKLLKEIENQAKKIDPKAKVICNEKGHILIDINYNYPSVQISNILGFGQD